MNLNTYHLPQERKFSFLGFWSLPKLILGLFISNVLVFAILTIIIVVSLQEPITLTLLSSFIPLGVLIFIFIILSVRDYSCLKNGERIYVKVVGVSRPLISFDPQTPTNSERKIMITFWNQQLRAAREYTYLPAFIYKKRVLIDWINVPQYALNIDGKSFANEEPIKEAPIQEEFTKYEPTTAESAEHAKKNHEYLAKSALENINNQISLMFILSLAFIFFGGLSLFLDLREISVINKISEDMTTSLIEGGGFVIVGITCFIFYIKRSSNKKAYLAALKFGDKAIAKSEVYHKSATKNTSEVAILSFLYEKDGRVYTNAFKNKYAANKPIYDILKEARQLPIIYYKNNIYPDWEGIANYIESKLAK